MTLISLGHWFMKCVDSGTNITIAYAEWSLPLALWDRVQAENGGGIQAEVSEAMRAAFEQEYEESCTSDGEPRGMRLEVVNACGPANRAACERVWPKGEEYISRSPDSPGVWYTDNSPELVQVKTLPAHQRRGAGQLLTQWGVDLANREALKICLESTDFGKRLYEKCGFEAREKVVHDISRFGGPEKYAWTMMVRMPEWHER